MRNEVMIGFGLFLAQLTCFVVGCGGILVSPHGWAIVLFICAMGAAILDNIETID